MEWVQDQLSVRVKNIRDIDELNRDWLQDDSAGNNATSASSSHSSSRAVKVLLLTHLLHPPLFLAALSIKFTGRIKFGMFSVRKEDSEAVRKKLKLLDHRIPSYIIITPEQKIAYGRRRFEHFNFASMNLFLRAVQPEMNDVFLCSLVLVNMLASLQIFQVRAYTFTWWEIIYVCIYIMYITAYGRKCSTDILQSSQVLNFYVFFWSWYSARLWAGLSGFGSWQCKIFLFTTASRLAHRASYSVGTGGYFLRG